MLPIVYLQYVLKQHHTIKFLFYYLWPKFLSFPLLRPFFQVVLVSGSSGVKLLFLLFGGFVLVYSMVISSLYCELGLRFWLYQPVL